MFTRAITRRPCKALIDGISTGQFCDGTPDYENAVKQHDKYIATLAELGLEVTQLEADERYPDSCFVEDPAVVMENCAVITNPARDSRNGEKVEILDVIKKFYDDSQIFHIEAPGTMEGGDIMQVGKHFYVGLSDRTNPEGAKQFNDIVTKFGYTSSTVPVTEGLHLKDFAIYLENNNMLVSGEFVNKADFAKYNKVEIPVEEAYAANCIWVNDTVIVPKGYPAVLAAVQSLGYKTLLVDTSEYRKLDGGLSCLSLRF